MPQYFRVLDDLVFTPIVVLGCLIDAVQFAVPIQDQKPVPVGCGSYRICTAEVGSPLLALWQGSTFHLLFLQTASWSAVSPTLYLRLFIMVRL